jgi:SAM-dependent methyltransferase
MHSENRLTPAPVTPSPQATNALTTSELWDEYWQSSQLPVEITKGAQTTTDAILKVIDRFLVSNSRLSVLEVGGAPGGYLAHVWRQFGHEVCVLDNSPVGIDLTRRNFKLLGIPGRVLEGDLFKPEATAPKFDVVFSLGLIEHFDDTHAVVAAHLDYLKPGGTLIVGCPNFRGVNLALLRELSPSLLEWHNLEAMDIADWPSFERRLGLEVKFRDYVGGFQPSLFWRCESGSIVDRALARGLVTTGRRMNGKLGTFTSRWNSRRWSYYALGVYRSRPRN